MLGIFFVKKVFAVLLGAEMLLGAEIRCELQSKLREKRSGGSLVRIHDCDQNAEQCKASASMSSRNHHSAGKCMTYLRILVNQRFYSLLFWHQTLKILIIITSSGIVAYFAV